MSELTPLAVIALGILAEQPRHPYEVYQLMLHRREDRNVKVRPGSLYHTIDRLAEQGFVEAVGTEREGNRPERTSYAITDAGRRAIEGKVAHMLAHPPREYPEFPVAIAEAHNLPAAQVAALLAERRTALAEDLEDLELAGEAVQATDLPRRFWLDLSFQTAMVRAELAWLDEHIPPIADGSISWTEPVDPHRAAQIEERIAARTASAR